MQHRYCLALDLKDDEDLIAEYEDQHKKVWPEILHSIKQSGIEHMEIYRAGSRLFMIMEVSESFSFEAKAIADAADEKVHQQALPFAKPGEKWLLMERIFNY